MISHNLISKEKNWKHAVSYQIRLIRNPLGTLVMWIDRKGLLRRAEKSIRRRLKRLMGKPDKSTTGTYSEWLEAFNKINNSKRRHIIMEINKLQRTPLISVIMPAYNSNPEWITAAIESVTSQLYPYWELCIADDASTDTASHNTIKNSTKKDSRIKVVFRTERGNISAASNTALEFATGGWVALLDHDDILAEDALFEVAKTINKYPNARLIYTDEDKIDASGKERSGPYFKPGWDYNLFCSHNLISHLGVYHRETLAQIGGFRPGFEGSQDYDLALRFIEAIDESQIHHIPKILYHWRIHPESTAQSIGAKPYATLAAQKALEEHYQRNGIPATCEITGSGYRQNITIPERIPLVSLIITSKNKFHLLKGCIESIINKTSYPNYEIIVVDNGSDDPSALEYLQAIQLLPNITVVRNDDDFNYSALNNAAVRIANGEIIGLINNDIEIITPEWLKEMVMISLQKRMGAVGALLYYPNNTIQHAGVVLGEGKTINVFKHQHRSTKETTSWLNSVKKYLVVTAACLVIKKSLYLEVGGLDKNLKVEFNDVDLCLKLNEMGYWNVVTPYAELYHHESASRGVDDFCYTKKKRHFAELAYIREKWGLMTLEDKCFNPNLALKEEGLSLAWPPRRG
jgi:glycosyltransferase involved in cell wall biosynthesis